MRSMIPHSRRRPAGRSLKPASPVVGFWLFEPDRRPAPCAKCHRGMFWGPAEALSAMDGQRQADSRFPQRPPACRRLANSGTSPGGDATMAADRDTMKTDGKRGGRCVTAPPVAAVPCLANGEGCGDTHPMQETGRPISSMRPRSPRPFPGALAPAIGANVPSVRAAQNTAINYTAVGCDKLSLKRVPVLAVYHSSGPL